MRLADQKKVMIRIDQKELAGTIRRLIWLGMILLVAGIIISAIESQKSSTSKEVLINIAPLKNGNSLITTKDILLTIERSFGYNLEGMPIVGLNVERIERVLEADAFILEATVYLDSQNRVHIDVLQREPLLRIIDKNGFNYYLDEAGVKIDLSKHFSARVLTVTGNIPPYSNDFLTRRKKNTLNDIFLLAKAILKDEFLTAQIEQIYVNSLGEIILIPMIGNHKILLGTCEDIAEKLERLKIFYKDGIPYEGWHKYASVSLKYKNQVVCKKR